MSSVDYRFTFYPPVSSFHDHHHHRGDDLSRFRVLFVPCSSRVFGHGIRLQGHICSFISPARLPVVDPALAPVALRRIGHQTNAPKLEVDVVPTVALTCISCAHPQVHTLSASG